MTCQPVIGWMGVIELLKYTTHARRTRTIGGRTAQRLRQTRRVHVPRESKVRDLQDLLPVPARPRGRQQQVLRLQIAVYQVLLAHRGEPRGHLRQHSSRRRLVDASVSFDVLADVAAVALDNVRVVALSQDFDLGLEALSELLRELLEVDLFDRDDVRFGREMPRAPHRGERPASDALVDHPAPADRARRRRRRVLEDHGRGARDRVLDGRGRRRHDFPASSPSDASLNIPAGKRADSLEWGRAAVALRALFTRRARTRRGSASERRREETLSRGSSGSRSARGVESSPGGGCARRSDPPSNGRAIFKNG
eukprot:31196-Pelagococcus_subviridis.AAC.1